MSRAYNNTTWKKVWLVLMQLYMLPGSCRIRRASLFHHRQCSAISRWQSSVNRQHHQLHDTGTQNSARKRSSCFYLWTTLNKPLFTLLVQTVKIFFVFFTPQVLDLMFFDDQLDLEMLQMACLKIIILFTLVQLLKLSVTDWVTQIYADLRFAVWDYICANNPGWLLQESSCKN